MLRHPKPTFLAAVRVLLGVEPPAALAGCWEVRLALRLRSPAAASTEAPPLLCARDGERFRGRPGATRRSAFNKVSTVQRA